MVKRKGGKKQVLHLSEFLGDAAPLTPTAVPTYTDECSTDLSLPAPGYSSSGPAIDMSLLPSAPRAQREGSFDPSKIPRYPPFTAYVGNLPFDSEDEDIIKMFQRNTVKEVRLLKDKDTGHFKGFGYVEFESAEGLIEALKINEKMVRGRAIKVDVATTSGQRDGREGGSSGDRWERGQTNERGEREPYVDNTSDDWRRDSKPQDSEGGPPPYEVREYRPRRFEGGNEDRNEDRPPRRNYNDTGNDTFSRDDFGTKMNEAAKEPYKPASRFRDEHDDRGERPSRGAWGTSSAPRENAWVRHGELAAEDAEGAAKERPRLNLKPRSVAATEQAQPKPVTKSNPFGNAKPVDIPEKQEKLRSEPEGREIENKKTSPKANPFGSAKPADTASWRSTRVQGTGPIKGPREADHAKEGKETEDDIITDSNKFMVLNDDED